PSQPAPLPPRPVAFPGASEPAPGTMGSRTAEPLAPGAALERPTAPSVSYANVIPAAETPRPAVPAIPPPRRPMPSSPIDVRALPSAPPAALAAVAPGPAGDRSIVDAARGAAQRAALLSLVERIGELCDLRPLVDGARADDALAERIERAIAD